MKGKNFYIVLLLILLSNFSIFIVHASQVYVDINSQKSLQNGSINTPYKSIQDAINNANSGDQVNVSMGVYRENIKMKSNVEVIGENPEICIIMGEPSVNGVAQFSSITNSCLSGFTITVDHPESGVDRGVVFKGTDLSCILSHCIIKKTQYGIFVHSPAIIINNTIVGESDEQGIYIGNDPVPAIIRNNIITGFTVFAGIHVVAGERVPLPLIEYNNVWNNKVDYKRIPDQAGRNGNISEDPMFKSENDYHLQDNSPCINSGDPITPLDPDGSRADIGVFPYYTQTTHDVILNLKLDDSTGFTAHDSSGQNHHGTLSGDVSWSERGLNGCLSFDGGYVQVSDDVLSYTENQDFTWMLFFKRDPNSGWNPYGEEVLISRRRYINDNDQVGAHLTIQNDGRCRIHFGTKADMVSRAYSISNVVDGNWHHIAAVRDTSSRQFRLYVDGVLEATVEDYGVDMSAPTGFAIGKEGEEHGGARRYHGLIDEVKILNYDLPEKNIIENASRLLILATWEEISTTTKPPSQYFSNFAYDSDRKKIILFSGNTGNVSSNTQTWEFDVSTNKWELMDTSKSPKIPTQRWGAAFAYDEFNKKCILFGGRVRNDINAPHTDESNGFYYDTWSWDGETWRLESLSGPRARMANMVYIPEQNRMILFGGQYNPHGDWLFLNDTWEWNGSSWKEIPTENSPPARGGIQSYDMAYDKLRKKIVLFGGSGFGEYLNQTWEFDIVQENWYLASDTGPDPRGGHSITYDSKSGYTILFGGHEYDGTYLNDTWVWNGHEWRKLNAYGPRTRQECALLFDPQNNRTILFGGLYYPPQYANLNDLWELTLNTPSTNPTPTPTPTPTYTYSPTYTNTPNATFTPTWTVTPTPTYSIPKSEIVLNLKLDDSTGFTAHDSSGQNHHGTLSGDVLWSERGLNGCLSFDGGYVQVSDDVLSYTENQDFTWMLFFKRDPNSGWNPYGEEVLISRRRYISDNDQVGAHLTIQNDGRCRIHFGTKADMVSRAYSTSNVVDGNWHHIAAVRDTSSRQYRLYVDGVLEATVEDYGVDMSAPSGFSIGKEGEEHGGARRYHGLIDEVRVYNHIVSEHVINEIKSLISEDSPKMLFTLTDHTANVSSLAFSPDGTKLLSGSYDKTAKLWDVSTGNLIKTFSPNTTEINSVAFSPEGTKVLTGHRDGITRLWDVQSGNILQLFEGHNDWVTSVDFSPDGSKIITGSNDRTAILWNTQYGTIENTFTGHGLYINSVKFSPDGHSILTGSYDDTVKLWDIKTADVIQTFAGLRGDVSSVDFTPNGSRVIAVGVNPQAYLWDLSGSVVRKFNHEANIYSVDFSSDGLKVITGGHDEHDNSAKIWNTMSGELLTVLKGHTHYLYASIFSPDDRLVATSGADKTIRIWELEKSDFVLGGTNKIVLPGKTINIPLDIQNLPSATSFTFELVYDHNLLEWQNEIIKTDSLVYSWGLVDGYNIEDGRLRISGAAFTGEPANGDGTLAFIPFKISQNVEKGTSIRIDFENLKDGLKGVTTFPIILDVLQCTKGDVNSDNDITAADAQMAFEIALGRIDPISEQSCAAEVTGDNDITAADAQKIFEVALGKSTFSNLSAKINHLHSVTLLNQITSVSVDSVQAPESGEVVVPIRIQPNGNITSLTMDVVYESEKITFAGIDKVGTLVEDFLLADANEVTSGTVRVAAAAITANPISNQGVLIKLLFTVNTQSNGKASISLQALKDDIATAQITNGEIILDSSSTILKSFLY